MSKKQDDSPMSFEQAIQQLELIVSQLESGDVPLEKAIELYQEGMKLSHFCAEKLQQVETQIEMLVAGESGTNRKSFTTSPEKKVNPRE